MLIKNPSAFKNSIGGPVMIYYMTAQTTKQGFSTMLTFVAMISILLMIMNLLPIPVFDGGHIMFFLIEGIFKRPLPMRVQIIAQQFGMLLLLFLMFFAFYSDISKVFQKQVSSSKYEMIE
jgi:regulator of sigma E protease